MNEPKTRWLIALVRVLVGAIFIHNALPKMNAAFLLGFDRLIASWASGNPFPWYQWFLKTVVAPNEQVFAIALMVCELAVGVALVIGLLTGAASLLGMFLTANTLFAASHLALPSSQVAWPYTGNLFAFLLLLLLFVLRAGRVYGLDARMGSSRSFWG